MNRRPLPAAIRALAIGLLALALSPQVAAANGSGPPKHLAPPGNPAVTQYLEDVPSDMGSTPPTSGATPAKTLSTSQRRRLEHMGAGGQLLVKVVDETAPTITRPATAVRSTERSDAASLVAGAPAQSEGSGLTSDSGSRGSVKAVLVAAAGQGGGAAGLLLPAVVGSGLLLIALAVMRRLRAGGS